MRSQEEIIKRFNESDDLFGTQQNDLVEFMTFESAEEFLQEDYVLKVKSGETKWEMKTDPKEQILNYLDFAYEKAEGGRGLSAGRSMLHFKTWIWLDDEDFYNEIIHYIDNYTNYGIPTLDMISEKYGYTR